MNGPTLAAVAVATVAAYGALIVLLGRWVGRAGREQTIPAPAPAPVTAEALERLWVDVQASNGQAVLPRQRSRFTAVGDPLTAQDLDRIIASFEPCGSTAPTCRLHDPATCRPDTPCCPTCPTVQTA